MDLDLDLDLLWLLHRLGGQELVDGALAEPTSVQGVVDVVADLAGVERAAQVAGELAAASAALDLAVTGRQDSRGLARRVLVGLLDRVRVGSRDV